MFKCLPTVITDVGSHTQSHNTCKHLSFSWPI